MNVKNDVSRLKSASAVLNTRTDQLTQDLLDLEALVNKLAPGVWVELQDRCFECDERTDHAEWVGFGKHEGRWGFLVVSGSLSDPDRRRYEFLCRAAREYRIRAASSMLPELLAALADATEEKAQDVEKAAAQARQVAQDLRAVIAGQ